MLNKLEDYRKYNLKNKLWYIGISEKLKPCMHERNFEFFLLSKEPLPLILRLKDLCGVPSSWPTQKSLERGRRGIELCKETLNDNYFHTCLFRMGLTSRWQTKGISEKCATENGQILNSQLKLFQKSISVQLQSDLHSKARDEVLPSII